MTVHLTDAERDEDTVDFWMALQRLHCDNIFARSWARETLRRLSIYSKCLPLAGKCSELLRKQAEPAPYSPDLYQPGAVR